MTTLADILLLAAECIGGLRHSTSTAAGTTATLVDTSMNDPVDFFNDGTIFFITGALAGKTAIITDWALTGTTFTFPTQTTAPGAGAQYAVLDNPYPREALVQAVNTALKMLGRVTNLYEDAAFVVVADQDEYTLPTGVSDLVRVQIAEDAAAPWDWMPPERNWVERGGCLEMREDSSDRIRRNWYVGNRIRLYYNAPAARLNADADLVPVGIEPIRLAWETVLSAATARRSKDQATKDLITLAAQRVTQMAMYPVRRMGRDSRFSGF